MSRFQAKNSVDVLDEAGEAIPYAARAEVSKVGEILAESARD
jgi:hypothetical protein